MFVKNSLWEIHVSCGIKTVTINLEFHFNIFFLHSTKQTVFDINEYLEITIDQRSSQSRRKHQVFIGLHIA